MFVGDMNFSRIMRFLPDKVNGVTQGAVLPFYDKKGLNRGCNRLAFAPDGSLWVGHTHLSWAGAKGLQRIVWTGKKPFDVKGIKAVKGGFELQFTKKLAPEVLKVLPRLKVKSYYYSYHAAYGSKRQDEKKMALKQGRLVKEDTLFISTGKHQANYVSQFELAGIKAADGTPLRQTLLCYFMKVCP